MKKFILIVCITIGISATAATQESPKELGDSAYASEQYEKAKQFYEKAEPSAAVYYNLGNCCYRLEDMAHAVLWYERALLLSPGDRDIRFNLDMARSKTIDKVTPQHEMFFISWYKWMVNLMSIDAWGWLSLTFFVLCLACLCVYIYTEPLWMRKTGFSLFVILLLFTILGNVCALSQRYRLNHRTGAIVMTSSAVIKSTPTKSGSDLFVLHEGTRVEIKDDTLNDWYEVELADGKIGWIPRNQIEII